MSSPLQKCKRGLYDETYDAVRSLNPRALKGKNKHMLPMFWRANRKVWVMAAIFLDWFHNCFVPQVERYLVEQNLGFKVLLLIHNAPGHPGDLNMAHRTSR